MNLSETELAPPAAQDAAPSDRRRPGRPRHINPELVPLLRGEPEPPVEKTVSPTYGDPDQLRGMRGVAVGVAISSALWAGIVFGGRWMFF